MTFGAAAAGVGSGAEGASSLQMSRKTEWRAIGTEQYRGFGQRLVATSEAEFGLLETREIVLHATWPDA